MKKTTSDNDWRWDRLLAAVLLGTMCLIAFANVVSRHLFHYSFSFTEELTINLFVWLVVIGSGMAFERGAHLGLVTLTRRFPRALQRWLSIIGAVCGALLFLAIDLLLIHSIYQEITIFHAKSSAFGFPIWIYFAGVPILSVFVFRGIYRRARVEWEAP